MKQYSYLALGDSYTIGEQVVIADSFPYQTVQILRKKGIELFAPEIIATTGWTTDELAASITSTLFLKEYDFVSLLIGVNNQYRGRSVSEFTIEFEHLLQTAIQLANNKTNHVFVLSIPDWGVTPFAVERETTKIAVEIDQFNEVCKQGAKKFDAHFIDITNEQRKNGNNAIYLAKDQLHPSGKEYQQWAQQLADKIYKEI